MSFAPHLLPLRPYPKIHSMANPKIRVECYVVIDDKAVAITLCEAEWSHEYVKEEPIMVFHAEFGEIVKTIQRGLFRELEKTRNYYGWGEKDE